MCFGLPACTQTRRASPYCSNMITTKTSVLSLQTTMRSCNIGMLSEIMYMLAGHSTPTPTGNVTFPVNSIVAEHDVKLCENHPTAHVLKECHKHFILNRNVCCQHWTAGSGGKRQTIFYNIRHEKMLIHAPSKRLFALSLYGIKARNCSSLDKIWYFSWARQQTNLLHTLHQQKMPSNNTSSQQGTRPTSNVTAASKLWTLILLSATDGICWMVSLNHVTSSKDSAPDEVRHLTIK